MSKDSETFLLPLTLKRIMGDIKKLDKEPLEFADAFPDEKNMLIWYFLLKGSGEYNGGWYIGKILHNKDYPNKPPDIQFITPSGRYETGRNICLSFTAYHPEKWSPMWNIQTLLIGLSSNMNDDQQTEQGIGYMKNTPEERKIYAEKSIEYNLKHHEQIFKNFKHLINPDGTPKTEEEIVKACAKSEKKKKEKKTEN